uniref:Uncharacterized protein n=1 Tax=Kalanchoe fedtschenkoi TaxID=63787 RepID=A0A7N0RAZ7_KALFE
MVARLIWVSGSFLWAMRRPHLGISVNLRFVLLHLRHNLTANFLCAAARVLDETLVNEGAVPAFRRDSKLEFSICRVARTH